MSNKSNWDYDDAKKMLRTLRTLNESKASHNVLKEEENPQAMQNQGTDYMVVNNVEVKMHSTDKADLQLSEDEKRSIGQLIDNFHQQVSDLAEFKEGININMADNEFRMDGSIADQDLSFVLIAGNQNTGVYVNAEMLKLDDDVNLTLGKLIKFQHTFEDAGNQFINERKYN